MPKRGMLYLLPLMSFAFAATSASEEFLIINLDELSPEYVGELEMLPDNWRPFYDALVLSASESIVSDSWWQEEPPYQGSKISFELCGPVGYSTDDGRFLGEILPLEGRNEQDELMYELGKIAFSNAVMELSTYPREPWIPIFSSFRIVRNTYQLDSVSFSSFMIVIPVASDGDQIVRYKHLWSLYGFADEINDAANEINQDLPKVEMADDCGGGEVPVTVRSQPDGARIWYLSAFGYQICEAEGKSSVDLSECDRWLEITGEETSSLGGVVYFHALWDDGNSIISKRNVDVLDEVLLVKQ